MAVRRLAEEQPESFAFTAENAAWAEREITKYPKGRQASAVIALLWRAQEQEGWVSEPAIEVIADMLHMPKIRVLEVATFYTMFHLAPVGKKAHVQVCGTTPCMLRGAEDIKEVCRRRIAPHPHEVSADGGFSWEEVECLGACVNAPVVQIFADTYEDLTPESFEAVLEAIARGDEPTPGPQIDRQFGAPASGPTTLFDVEGGSERTPRQWKAAPYPQGGESATSGNGAALGDKAPNPAAEDVAGGAPATPREATGREEKAASPNGKQQKAGRPTATGRPDEEAARSSPTDNGENLAAGPHKATTKERIEAETEDDDEPEARADAAGKRPAALAEPEGKKDDLKQISGVGPVLEEKLNGLGIWHFRQIAAWKGEEIAWMDEYLHFKGRIERDDWVGQAERLAEKSGQA
ncbi:NADH-quinone oxidoreductase subunit NuoE [Afifella pfennigii]|uniref:NADH-quinone oxidoreductase subunit NuoE n=1 Tax=Afifella pfennigii TaxID=209897 RepID=UPI000554CBBA|nr:NADH-quinone oxidoreductase subunit NuoE [Afifella pfennigii]